MQPTALREENVYTADPFLKYYEEFLELAAHDLGAPVRKLGVFTERLTSKYTDTGSSEEVKEYVGRIHSSLEELRALVNGMKEYSKLIPQAMNFTNCDTRELLERALVSHDKLLKTEGTKIEYDDDLPVVFGDETQLNVLFKAIIDNCIKFRKKNIQLIIKITVNEEDPSHYRFQITDNGIGLRDQQQERSFFPLKRIYGKTEYPGNGLGLACVKRVAENHGGTVFFEEGREEGASIIFIIPKNQ